MKTRFVSHKDKVLDKISKQLSSNLNAAAEYSVRHIKEKISTGGSVTEARYNIKTNKVRRVKVGVIHSKPWEPPYVQTGHLRNSIGYEVAGKQRGFYKRRIGTGIKGGNDTSYAICLEFGTRNMLPRPYMRPSMYETRDMVKKLVMAGLE